MNDLSALGEDQPPWREWLSKHLMPLYQIERLSDGQVEVRQRHRSDAHLDPTGTSTADKVLDDD